MTIILTQSLMVAAGIASHVAFFNRGEHHMYGPRYVQIFLALFVIAVHIVIMVTGDSIVRALSEVLLLAIFFLAGIYTSLLAYRVFFSPLSRFPGPIGARISNFWFSLQLKNLNAYNIVLQLHEDYGDFVRIGSNDLSIIHPKAVDAIYGLGSKCRKADWYDINQPMVSLHMTRHQLVHDKRRRIWSTAFSDKALRGYQDRIKVYRNRLIAQIASFGGQPVNVTKWFGLYSFDVMGDLAFGRSFEMLESNEEHWAIKLLNEGMKPLGYFFPTWFFRIIITIPTLMDDWWKFVAYFSQMLDKRMKTDTSTPDIMSTLLGPYKDTKPTETDMKMLSGDSQLIVVAGSDTTATTLTYALYELARNPEHISRLREELALHTSSSDDILDQELQYLDHLNGVIHETLRLHPPVPTAVQRLTPPEGLEIGHMHIPGNVTVWCPQYVIGRSENVYINASSFIPERWYSRPEMIKERSAFAPFSIGHYSCIGRPLALLIIRTMLAKLLLAFDIGFAPGDKGVEFEEKSKESFTLAPGELNIVFKKR